MKKALLVFSSLFMLLLCACTKTAQEPPATPEPPVTSEPAATPEPAEIPEPAAETVPAPEASAVIEAGSVDNGVYRFPFFGIQFPLDETWKLASRSEIAKALGYNEDYAAAEIEEVLSFHVPYVDLYAGKGTVSLQIMAENPPLRTSDGADVTSPAEYMDHNAVNLPQLYENMGLKVTETERGQRELCGMSFEWFSFTSKGAYEMVQTMMATEKDGYFLVIYITCIGANETESILEGFERLS